MSSKSSSEAEGPGKRAAKFCHGDGKVSTLYSHNTADHQRLKQQYDASILDKFCSMDIYKYAPALRIQICVTLLNLFQTYLNANKAVIKKKANF